MNLSYTDKVTIKILLFFVVSLLGIVYYFYDGGTILMFLVIRLVGVFFNGCNAIASHRWLCHNSFKASKLGKFLMLFSLVITGYGKPLHLVIAHRLHHRYSDLPLDPHSPKDHSFLKLWLGRYKMNDNYIIPKDFFKNKEAVFVNRYYWTLFFIFNLALALVDLKTALVFSPICFIYSWTLNTIVNYHGHYDGLTYEPRNLGPVITFMTSGEGLHKNHHDNQSSYSLSNNGDRFDLGSYLIDYLLRAK